MAGYLSRELHFNGGSECPDPIQCFDVLDNGILLQFWASWGWEVSEEKGGRGHSRCTPRRKENIRNKPFGCRISFCLEIGNRGHRMELRVELGPLGLTLFCLGGTVLDETR